MPRRDRSDAASWPIDRLKPHPGQARVFHDTPDAEFEDLKAPSARVDQVRSPRADEVATLETARRLIDELLGRTRCPARGKEFSRLQD